MRTDLNRAHELAHTIPTKKRRKITLKAVHVTINSGSSKFMRRCKRINASDDTRSIILITATKKITKKKYWKKYNKKHDADQKNNEIQLILHANTLFFPSNRSDIS